MFAFAKAFTQTDRLQAVGRAIRLSEGKEIYKDHKIAVFISDRLTQMTISNLPHIRSEVLWPRSHDESLGEMLEQFRNLFTKLREGILKKHAV